VAHVGPVRGEHVHAVRRGSGHRGELPVGYRIVGWMTDDAGVVVGVSVLDADGQPTTLAELEVRVRQGGRRVEMVPFGVSGCCDLNRRR